MKTRAIPLVYALLAASLVEAQPLPIPITPGSADRFETILQVCPTFSWAAPHDAEVRLLVYALDEDGDLAPGDEAVIRVDLAPGATSWTPPARLCLERGRLYGWIVLAGGRAGTAHEPEVRLFSVATEHPDLETVVPANPAGTAADIAARAVGPSATDPWSAPELPASAAPASPPNLAPEIPPRIGSPLPADLIVEQGIRYEEAQQGALGLPGNTFLLGSEDIDDVVQRSTAGFLWLSSIVGAGDVYLIAPVPMPQGVYPWGLQCDLYDASETANVRITWQMNRRARGTSTRHISGSVPFTTNSSSGFFIGATLGFDLGPTISGDYWWVEVRWQPDVQGDVLRFYGCQVLFNYWNLQH